MANNNRKIDNWWLGWVLAAVIVGVIGYRLDWTTSAIWRNFGLYRQWESEIQRGNFAQAAKIAKRLGEETIPEHVQLRDLWGKENKTVGEWLKLAQLATRLGQKEKAAEAIKRAWEMDPIRPDVEKLYFESIRK